MSPAGQARVLSCSVSISATGSRHSRIPSGSVLSVSSTGKVICWLKGMAGYRPFRIQEIWTRLPSSAGTSLQVCAAYPFAPCSAWRTSVSGVKVMPSKRPSR